MDMKETDYDKIENKFIELAEQLTTRFNINREELIDIIKDRID